MPKVMISDLTDVMKNIGLILPVFGSLQFTFQNGKIIDIIVTDRIRVDEK